MPPTCCVAPDGNVGQSGFKFDRLGVRVPMILVSPFINSGTVFRAPEGSAYDFDHTSFIATMLKWAGVDPTTAGLGARVAVAPTFEGVLSDTPREDKPSFLVPAGYSSQGGGMGHIDLGGLDLKIPIAKPIKGLDVHQFRQAIDTSVVAEDFVKWLSTLS